MRPVKVGEGLLQSRKGGREVTRLSFTPTAHRCSCVFITDWAASSPRSALALKTHNRRLCLSGVRSLFVPSRRTAPARRQQRSGGLSACRSPREPLLHSQSMRGHSLPKHSRLLSPRTCLCGSVKSRRASLALGIISVYYPWVFSACPAGFPITGNEYCMRKPSLLTSDTGIMYLLG